MMGWCPDDGNECHHDGYCKNCKHGGTEKVSGKTEYVFCAVNDRDEIQWVTGSSSKTRYFKTDKYLKQAVEYHNTWHGDDPWRVAKFELNEVWYEG